MLKFSTIKMKMNVLAFALSLAAVLTVTACGNGPTKVVFTTGFGQDEIFRINNSVCKKSELMVYLITSQQQYEEVYGPLVWKIQKDGVTLEDNVKETVLARIAQIKTMCLLAQSKEIELDEKELECAGLAAEYFFNSLSPEGIELLQIDQETVDLMYQDYALANKVYQHIIEDINPEISDDEARIITVQTIYQRTGNENSHGEWVEYPAERKQEIRKKAIELRELVMEGQDFLDIASKYSDNDTITWSFGKNETDPAIEQVAFLLETDEVSPVIETEKGYYILKCVTTFNREETDANKIEIVEQRRKDVFGVEYEQFTSQLARQLNTKIWNEIELIHDDNITMYNFFDVYEKFFAQDNRSGL